MLANIHLSPKALLTALASLIVMVGITFTYVTWHWVSDWRLAHQPIVQAQIETHDQSNELVAAIPTEHLFGLNTKSGDVPITNLQLRVTGIVKEINDAAAASKVYISIAGGAGKIYRVGDKLPYGVNIYDITPSMVILENNGQLEKLPLPRESLQFKPQNKLENA